MATALDIIKRALRVAKVVDAGSAPLPEDSVPALETLNAMLAEWHEAEIGLPDYTLAALSTTLASDAADREAIAYQLAVRIVGEYGTQMAPSDQMLAEQTMARLRLRYFQPGRVDFGLPCPTGFYDFTTDTY